MLISNFSKLLIVGASALSMLPLSLSAYAEDDVSIAYSPASQSKLLLSDVKRFLVATPSGDGVIKLVSRQDASYKTPEATMAAAISAASIDDQEWLYETMSASQAAKKRIKNRSEDYRKRAGLMFDLLFRGKKIVITKKIASGKQVMLQVSTFDPDSNQRLFTYVYVFEKVGGRWIQAGAEDKLLLKYLRNEFDGSSINGTYRLMPVISDAPTEKNFLLPKTFLYSK